MRNASIIQSFSAVLLGVILVASSASASSQIAGKCDVAAQTAARETGVPLAVLKSITRTETGRARNGILQPWPWTVNMEGTGKWFDTEDAARTYVFKHFKRGARSFDVGCFQINYKWHHGAFRSIDEMFDPLENARYAAQFLTQLYAESNDWSQAAGAYHSRTPKYAKKYRARFEQIRRDLSNAGPAQIVDLQHSEPAHRSNSFPLLQKGAVSGAHGSLVPLHATGAKAIIQRVQKSGGS